MRKNIYRFPGPADFNFWSTKCAPSWTKPFCGDPAIGIDDCVNAHAGLKKLPFELEAHNLCSMLKGRRARGANIEEFLEELIRNPGTIMSTAKNRVRFSTKWLRKIKH